LLTRVCILLVAYYLNFSIRFSQLASSTSSSLSFFKFIYSTLVMFHLLSFRADLAKYIEPFIALAPIFYLDHQQEVNVGRFGKSDFFLKWLNMLGEENCLKGFFDFNARRLCKEGWHIRKRICKKYMAYLSAT